MSQFSPKKLLTLTEHTTESSTSSATMQKSQVYNMQFNVTNKLGDRPVGVTTLINALQKAIVINDVTEP